MRTPDQVRADIEALEASGKKNPKKKGMLRGELIEALEAENEALKAPSTMTVSGVSPVTSLLGDSLTGATDPFDTDEWRFIEKSIAEQKLDLRGGSTTGIVKHIFNLVDAKLKIWRLTRELVSEIGIGVEWPQFSALGRDDRTGKKKAPKKQMVEVPKVVAPDPEPALVSPEAVAAAARGVQDTGTMAQDIAKALSGTLGGAPVEMTESELEAAAVK